MLVIDWAMTKQRSQTWFLLGCLILVNGVIWLPELLTRGPDLNDAVLHLHQVRHMDQVAAAGGPLLNHWDSTLGTGYPFLRTYAPGAHLLIWGLYRLSGRSIAPALWFHALAWLFWTLLPLSYFWGLRLLGMKRGAAFAAACMLPFLHTGFRFGIAPETYARFGYGLLPNLLGVFCFPLALGYGRRFVRGRGSLIPALAWLAAAWLCHLVMGYAAALSLCLWTLAELRFRPPLKPALLRLFVLAAAAITTCIWFLAPYFLDGPFINRSQLEPDHYWFGYGPLAVMAAALRGSLLDHHVALPLVSLLTLFGICRTLSQPALRKRPWLWWFLIFFLLYLGRAHNPIAWLLPMGHSIPFERWIVPLQLAAVALAGLGHAWLFRRFFTVSGRARELCRFVSLLLLLGLHIGKNVQQLWQGGAALALDAQQSFDSVASHWQKVQTVLAGADGGRVLVPPRRVGRMAPLEPYHLVMYADLDHIGRPWHTMSMNADFLADLNPARPDHLALFGVKYTLAPNDMWPFQHLQTLIPHPHLTLKQNQSYTGLFAFGYAAEVLEGHPRDHRKKIKRWMQQEGVGTKGYLVFTGTSADGAQSHPNLPSGPLLHEEGFAVASPDIKQAAERTIRAKIRAPIPCLLIVKMTYHPGWHVQVNGAEVPTYCVSPSFLAFPVTAGVSEILLRY